MGGKSASALIIAIMLVFSAGGCGDVVETTLNDGEPVGALKYFPYRPGDTYTLRAHAGSTTVFDTLVYLVRPDTVINGRRYNEHDLVSSKFIGNLGSENSTFYRFTGDTIMTKHQSENVERFFAIFSLKNEPATSNVQAYTYVDDTAVVAPAGAFSGVKRLRWGTLAYEIYFAPDAGFVLMKLGGSDRPLIRARIRGRKYGN